MTQSALTGWYGKLSPRDQRIVLYGAVVVGIILLLWVALPLQRNLGQMQDRLEEQEDQLEWMKRASPALAAAGPGRPASSGSAQSLVVLIDTSARESGLAKALTGTTPAGNGAMRVQLENADFNLLLGWLHRLTTQHGLQIEDLSVTSSNGGSGLVNVSLQLRPGK